MLSGSKTIPKRLDSFGKDRPLKIGLTGGIGAGKSLVLDILHKKGIPVLQTDQLGHRLLTERKFSKVLIKEFGKGIQDGRGRIDRQKLGKRVFQSARSRERLNRLVHPEIRRRVAQWVEKEGKKRKRPDMVVVEVPLLFERGF